MTILIVSGHLLEEGTCVNTTAADWPTIHAAQRHSPEYSSFDIHICILTSVDVFVKQNLKPTYTGKLISSWL